MVTALSYGCAIVKLEITELTERALKIARKDNCSKFQELLDKNNSYTIHERKLKFLVVEMYKIQNGFAVEIYKIQNGFAVEMYKIQNGLAVEIYKIQNGLAVEMYKIQNGSAVEIYKIQYGLSPLIMCELFPIRKCNINLRSGNNFETHNVRTVYNGKHTVSFQEQKILYLRSLRMLFHLECLRSKLKSGNQQDVLVVSALHIFKM